MEACPPTGSKAIGWRQHTTDQPKTNRKVFDIIHNLPYGQVAPPALTIAKLVSGRTVGWVLVRC
jgi:alkylated DNA nucleotide flippase Atl1